MKTTTYQAVAKYFTNIFSLFGYPSEVVTDNGPPWDSTDLANYFKSRNIKHHPSIPLWPRSNGQAESFMKVINKTVRHSYIFFVLHGMFTIVRLFYSQLFKPIPKNYNK